MARMHLQWSFRQETDLSELPQHFSTQPGLEEYNLVLPSAV